MKKTPLVKQRFRNDSYLFSSKVINPNRAGKEGRNKSNKCTDLPHIIAADTDLRQNT